MVVRLSGPPAMSRHRREGHRVELDFRVTKAVHFSGVRVDSVDRLEGPAEHAAAQIDGDVDKAVDLATVVAKVANRDGFTRAGLDLIQTTRGIGVDGCRAMGPVTLVSTDYPCPHWRSYPHSTEWRYR